MKKIFLLIWVTINTVLFAQYNFDFSGYIVEMPIYSHSNEDLAIISNSGINNFINLTRLRLRPTFFLWNNARINLEYEISGFSNTKSGIFDLEQSRSNNRQLVDLSWDPINYNNYSLTHFIDRLYFKQSFDFGNVEIGRQRISWGTGRVWNPTDLFNPINPATYYKLEKDGADAISLKYIFGNFTDLNVVYNPQKIISKSNYGFRLRTNYSEYDLSVMGGYFDERIIAGGDFAGNLFDAGVRGEGILSIDKNSQKNKFVKFILGSDYQFSSKLYGMIEYQFNGEGKREKINYEFIRLQRGEILNLSMNYLVIMFSYQITPLFTVSYTNNANLNDKSGYLSLAGDYSISENFYLHAGSQITYGQKYSELVLSCIIVCARGIQFLENGQIILIWQFRHKASTY